MEEGKVPNVIGENGRDCTALAIHGNVIYRTFHLFTRFVKVYLKWSVPDSTTSALYDKNVMGWRVIRVNYFS